MKKFIPIVVIISIVFGVIFITSCTCKKDTLAKFPFGEVVEWKVEPRNDFKSEFNREIQEDEHGDLIIDGDYLYQRVEVAVTVKNSGENGYCVFHAACEADTGRYVNEDSQGVSLNQNSEDTLYFNFWVDRQVIPREASAYEETMALWDKWGHEVIAVQAVNLHDFVEEEN